MFKKLLQKKPATVQVKSAISEVPDIQERYAYHSDTELLKCVMEIGHECVWYIESPDRYSDSPVFLSHSARRLLGLTPDEEVGTHSLMQRVHTQHQDAFTDFVFSSLSHGPAKKPLQCMVKTDKTNFQWFLFQAKYCVEFSPPRLVGIIKNIEQQTTQARLFDIVSTRFDLSREMLNDGLWDLDIIGGNPLNPDNVFWWSPQFRKLLGFETVEEFPDVMDSWASRLHPDDRQAALDAFVKHLMDYSGKTGFDIEYRLKLRSGEYRWFQARGQTKRAHDGTPLRAVGALIDIQARKDRRLHEDSEVRRNIQTAEAAKEIAELVSENGNIAAQIKLISLNASIEAARAGIHGRGFSVIASAIRGLAERTADITGQISRLQKRIQSFSDSTD
ncbi:PAS domain-containing protein [Pantoea sp. Acro-805]|uniref:histidine kinase n=1 Tax=Candidatus Pantoea formicae TaxID=2608355 RepID=A0ABX0R3X9_9GAMM|nr:PAS domain-containing methyl-accepting chemotaxis protein [Pantoea formicae]MDF7651006.1 PAS domain-containing methyl-accepting chemotaxis protein [Erwiniaceae bacterium L1_54_3]NIF02670.1 PAS domain-containing protein [Pantoea formicae]